MARPVELELTMTRYASPKVFALEPTDRSFLDPKPTCIIDDWLCELRIAANDRGGTAVAHAEAVHAVQNHACGEHLTVVRARAVVLSSWFETSVHKPLILHLKCKLSLLSCIKSILVLPSTWIVLPKPCTFAF